MSLEGDWSFALVRRGGLDPDRKRRAGGVLLPLLLTMSWQVQVAQVVPPPPRHVI
jgi:hypothetical protein